MNENLVFSVQYGDRKWSFSDEFFEHRSNGHSESRYEKEQERVLWRDLGFHVKLSREGSTKVIRVIPLEDEE